MALHLSHDFDGIVYAPPEPCRQGDYYFGPSKCLQWLEGQLGLSGYPANPDYLRIELYRQALHQHVTESPQSPFFQASFEADRFATAEVLLSWRDELLLGGWNFQHSPDAPERLQALAAVEQIFSKKIQDPELGISASGFSDRFEQVLIYLALRPLPIDCIYLYEPENLYVPVLRRLIQVLRQQGIAVETRLITGQAATDSPLGKLQDSAGQGAGQLVVLRTRRDSDAATFLAQILRENPQFKPVLLLPEMNLLLEQNLVQEGLAPMGVLSASLARPSLQVLKLAPAFLWEPIEIFKIMEFVTLTLKPLDAGLALEIARVLAEKPGLFSDTWFAAVLGYLQSDYGSEAAQKQYDFWFDRRRYPSDATAPKWEAVALYAYLQEWALEYYEASGSSNSSLLVLAEQARRIRELLDTLPEQRIGYLELERIVRTIYEPSPMQLAAAEKGCAAFIHKTGALATPVEDLIWWNCVFENQSPLPNKWQLSEQHYLQEKEVLLETPRSQSQRQQMLQWRPILQTSRQLWLVIPDQVDGAEAVPPLLLSDLEAIFGEKLAEYTYCLENPEDRARLATITTCPPTSLVSLRDHVRPKPYLTIVNPARLVVPEYETPTQLDNLFYYPHRWFFRRQLKLSSAGLLHVTGDNTLLGSLAHRFFEKLLTQNIQDLNRSSLDAWIAAEALQLLPKEGATLLLYGREPERLSFLNRVKNAAWSLLTFLRNNQWEVVETEMELMGEFAGTPIRGKADLVLRRGHEWCIVDLKWSGAKRRKELIKNGEDIQLILYAHLLPPAGSWPHTAYFIMDEGKMIARNRAAFSDAVAAGMPDEDHAAAGAAIIEKMEKTYRWRYKQFERGQIEIRTERTAIELEALYEGELFDLLEMKQESSRWDDYSTLIG